MIPVDVNLIFNVFKIAERVFRFPSYLGQTLGFGLILFLARINQEVLEVGELVLKYKLK